MVASPEKLHVRLMRFCMTMSSRLAISVTPYLYLDGVGTLAVEVSQWEVLFQLFEQQLYIPSLAVNRHNVLHTHLHVVGQERHEPRPCLLDVDVSDNPRMVNDVLAVLDTFRESHMLFPVLHRSRRRHVHPVALDVVHEAFLHLRDIGHASFCELLELGVVDVRPVDGQDVSRRLVGRDKHEAVVGGRRREADVRRHPLVGVYVRVDLYAAFLPARFRTPPHALEKQVGEKRDGCGVYDLEAAQPLRHLPLSAVRGKLALVGGVQVAVGRLEDVWGPPGVGIRERRTPGHHAYPQMRQLASLGEHRVRNLTQGVEALDDRLEHDHQVLPCVEVLHVPLPALLAAESENF